MDWTSFILLVADVVRICFPCSLIFGLTAKLCNIAFDLIFNRRIEM